MTTAARSQSHEHTSFGRFLRFLRRRARLTQRELAIAVNYSEGQVCHLENDRRVPELTVLAALFVPALGLEDEPDDSTRLLALAARARSASEAIKPTSVKPARPIAQQHVAPLVGRAAHRASLETMLLAPEVRLVTLIGPPGVGKTHLAQQLAHDLHARFRDGAVFIDLSAIDDAALVAQTIASTLDLGEEGGVAPLQTLSTALADREMLLVLDNFEQVADAASVVAGLLAATQAITVLVTSRVVLRLREEHVWTLPTLAVPDLAHLPPPDELARNDAVALLLARLRLVDPSLELTPSNALALAALCVRVDGLPLALEFIASRGRLFTPQELVRDVAWQFQHIRRRGRDVPERHRTLRAALQWSYDQLAPATQAVFARLSVFVGRWSVDLVAPVCDIEAQGHEAIFDHLEDLIEHSLLERHTDNGETYLSMLVMVRDYATERLHERDERSAVQERLLDATIAFAERAEYQFIYGDEQAASMSRANHNADTLRVALGVARDNGAATKGLRLAAALWRYWYLRGSLREGRHWLETFLALDVGPATVRAHALDGAGILAWRQGDHAQSEAWMRAALDLYRREQHAAGEARVLSHLGLLLLDAGAVEQSRTSFEDARTLNHAIGDVLGEANALHNLANVACQHNDNGRALDLYRQCLALYRAQGRDADVVLVQLGIGAIERDWGEAERALATFTECLASARAVGDEWATATALLNLGDLACDRGDTANALRILAEALAIYERLGDQKQIVAVQSRLGIATLAGNDRSRAVGHFRQCLMLSNALGYQAGIVEGLDGLAACVARTQPLVAARLFAATAHMRELHTLPVAMADALRHEQTVQGAQERVDAAAWATAWAEGQRLDPAHAVALALSGL